MHVKEIGTGAPVLLLHGGGVAGWLWRPTLSELGGGVRAIVPDLPGHGSSAALRYRSHAEVLAGLVDVLEERAPAGAVVAGFSLGAQVAILLAATRPDLVHRVVVVSAQNLPLPLERTTLALLGATAPLAARPWFARWQAAALGLPEALVGDYLRDAAAISSQTLLASVAENLRFRLPEGWSRYPGPAVVMVGERERKVMLDSARASHAALPDSTLVRVSGCGHDLPLRRPDLVARAILDRLPTGDRTWQAAR